MYIGHLPGEGANALTGVGVTFPVIMAISAFAALVSMGGAPRASIMLGKGRKDEAENILGNCTTALITVAVVLTAFFLIFGRRILLMFGASGNTIEYGWAYMQIYSLGTIFVQLALGLNAFINAQGICQDRYVHRAHWGHMQHHPGPHSHVCVSHGCSGRCPGHHHIPGNLRCLGCPVPDIE